MSGGDPAKTIGKKFKKYGILCLTKGKGDDIIITRLAR